MAVWLGREKPRKPVVRPLGMDEVKLGLDEQILGGDQRKGGRLYQSKKGPVATPVQLRPLLSCSCRYWVTLYLSENIG